MRVHFDWRQRLAGNAAARLGAAHVTLAGRFLTERFIRGDRELGPSCRLRLVRRPRMDIYLPIAGQSVNALFIVVLGFLVGLLSGMFGVGGGFLTTPLLIFYGIPPTVAVASAATQITGASVSGVMVHMRRGGVDMKMAGVMIVGGLVGSIVGAGLFRVLQSSGQIDVVIGFLYVLILGCDRRADAEGCAGRARLRQRARPAREAAAAQSLGRLAAAALALLQLGPLHLAARAAWRSASSPACSPSSSASAAASSSSRR